MLSALILLEFSRCSVTFQNSVALYWILLNDWGMINAHMVEVKLQKWSYRLFVQAAYSNESSDQYFIILNMPTLISRDKTSCFLSVPWWRCALACLHTQALCCMENVFIMQIFWPRTCVVFVCLYQKTLGGEMYSIYTIFTSSGQLTQTDVHARTHTHAQTHKHAHANTQQPQTPTIPTSTLPLTLTLCLAYTHFWLQPNTHIQLSPAKWTH